MNTLKNKYHQLSLIFAIIMFLLDILIRDEKGYVFGFTVFILFIIFFVNFYIVSNRLSVLLKDNYPDLYKKYAGRKYIFKDLRSVEFFRISKSDLLTIPIVLSDEIQNSKRRLLYVVFIIFCFVFLFTFVRFLLSR